MPQAHDYFFPNVLVRDSILQATNPEYVYRLWGSFINYANDGDAMEMPPAHCGTKPGRFETSVHSISHELGSE